MSRTTKGKLQSPYGRKVSIKARRALRDKVRVHDFASHRYRVVWKKPPKSLAGGDAWGLCEDNKAPEKTIHINPNLAEYDFLTTCLDEAIHACIFSLDNEYVAEMSDSMANFLWRIGFRMKED